MPRTVRSRTLAAVIVLAFAGLMLFPQQSALGLNFSAIGGILLYTVFWIAIIGGGIWLAVEFFGVLNAKKMSMDNDAVSTLRQRYARGEINRAEYFQMLQDLENS